MDPVALVAGETTRLGDVQVDLLRIGVGGATTTFAVARDSVNGQRLTNPARTITAVRINQTLPPEWFQSP